MNTFEQLCIKHSLAEFGQIYAVELSPYNLSQDLILIGVENEILLGHLTLTVGDSSDDIELEILARFPHETRCISLTFSPDCSVQTVPNNIQFASAGSDFSIRMYKGTLKYESVCTLMSGHTDHINDVKFDPENIFVASASDDHTVKLWDPVGNVCVFSLTLTSPGMSVGWHRDDNSKLLVAEKIGLIRFYNVETQCPILSLDFCKPLSNAHWAPSDAQLMGSLQLGELLIWDLSKPCAPVGSSLIFNEAGGSVKFSPFGEIVAAVNHSEGLLKVIHVQSHQLKASVPLVAPSNVSWHCRIPLLCIGDYMTLCFFRIGSK